MERYEVGRLIRERTIDVYDGWWDYPGTERARVQRAATFVETVNAVVPPDGRWAVVEDDAGAASLLVLVGKSLVEVRPPADDELTVKVVSFPVDHDTVDLAAGVRLEVYNRSHHRAVTWLLTLGGRTFTLESSPREEDQASGDLGAALADALGWPSLSGST